MAGNNNIVQYRGPEQRRVARRQSNDRRNAVRWEPSKDDRRHNYGRRTEDQTWQLSKNG